MWLLKKLTEEESIQYLISEKKSYTIGRKNCDVVLSDSSISRTHCVINIAKKNECPFTISTPTGVWIVDQKSKYGTYIQKNQEWMRITEETNEQLLHGTVIRWGVLNNIWRLEYKPLVISTSKVSSEQTKELRLLLSTVDGRLLNKWARNCTHVIVNDITLTIKVVLALINGVPIVKYDYIKQLIDNVKHNLAWPDYKQYKPEITESTLIPHLVSLDICDNRKELFKGKTFFVPSKKQFENLREIILEAGGNIKILEIDGNWRILADENNIVIQLPFNKIINCDQNATNFKNIASVLKDEYDVRVIPETEIYQAIAYSSIKKYCNPKCQEFELRCSPYVPDSCDSVIQRETPMYMEDGKSSDSFDFDMPCSSNFDSSKRGITCGIKRVGSPEEDGVHKRPALEATEAGATSQKKIYESTSEESDNEDQNVIEEQGSSKVNLTMTLRDLKMKEDGSSYQELDMSKSLNEKHRSSETRVQKRKIPCASSCEKEESAPKLKKKCDISINLDHIIQDTENEKNSVLENALHEKHAILKGWFRAKSMRSRPDDGFTAEFNLENSYVKKCVKKSEITEEVKYTEEEHTQIVKMLTLSGWQRAKP